ncbi:GtrA family protein [Thermomonas sp. LB-4]|uniref:GtrA family protein n=1 Tax=Thermomonas sp. LB-4 TaxID=3102790 RepID=UPI002EDA635C
MQRALPPSAEKLRFLLAGGSTTAASYALYLGLLALDVTPMPAYVASYLAGIVWSYAVNVLWVFRSRPRWRSFIRYPLVYLLQAIASFALFPLLLQLGAARWAAPLLVTGIMLPATFLLSRAIVRE